MADTQIRCVRLTSDGQLTEHTCPEADVGALIPANLYQVINVESDSGDELGIHLDEEGKLRPHARNDEATAFVRSLLRRAGADLMPGDYMHDTIVIAGGFDDEGHTLGVPDAALAEIHEFHRGWHR